MFIRVVLIPKEKNVFSFISRSTTQLLYQKKPFQYFFVLNWHLGVATKSRILNKKSKTQRLLDLFIQKAGHKKYKITVIIATEDIPK